MLRFPYTFTTGIFSDISNNRLKHAFNVFPSLFPCLVSECVYLNHAQSSGISTTRSVNLPLFRKDCLARREILTTSRGQKCDRHQRCIRRRLNSWLHPPTPRRFHGRTNRTRLHQRDERPSFGKRRRYPIPFLFHRYRVCR